MIDFIEEPVSIPIRELYVLTDAGTLWGYNSQMTTWHPMVLPNILDTTTAFKSVDLPSDPIVIATSSGMTT